MSISSAGRNSSSTISKVARTYRGMCGICFMPIVAGESYFTCVGGTNTRVGYLAHKNCYAHPELCEAHRLATG